MTARATPFDMVFGDLAGKRFPAVRQSLGQAGIDPGDRDAFVLDREATSLVHDLLPEGGMGSAVHHLAALVHHAYLFWDRGSWLVRLGRDTTRRLLSAEPGTPVASGGNVPDSYYLQLPPRLVWGRLENDATYQPLDGCFVHRWKDSLVSCLAVLGLHPDRMGFSVVEARVHRGDADSEPDASVFAPRMEGGTHAGLFSVTTPHDLITMVRWSTPAVAAAVARADSGEHTLEVT